MIYQAETINNETIDLGKPLKVEINKSNSAVADDLLAVFSIKEKIDELKKILVYSGKEKVFIGQVDTQKITCSNDGSILTVSARSLAAFLLDNEACPQTYYLPSLQMIFDRHAKPYGFTNIKGDLRAFSEEFVILKGMSEWEVIESFCSKYLRVKPKITVDGTIIAENNENEDIFFSNKNNGINYSFISEEIKRYKLYSDILIRTQNNDNYSLKITDQNAKKRGIIAKRYLNADENTVVPAVYGEIMLNRAQKNAYEIHVICPGQVNANIGDKSNISGYLIGDFSNLEISKIKYILDKNNEKTEITLQRSDL